MAELKEKKACIEALAQSGTEISGLPKELSGYAKMGTRDEGRGGGDGGAEGDAGTHPAHRGWQEGHPQGREGQAKHADGEAVPEDRHAGEVFEAEDREEGMNGKHAKSRLTGEELLQKRTTLYKV